MAHREDQNLISDIWGQIRYSHPSSSAVMSTCDLFLDSDPPYFQLSTSSIQCFWCLQYLVYEFQVGLHLYRFTQWLFAWITTLLHVCPQELSRTQVQAVATHPSLSVYHACKVSISHTMLPSSTGSSSCSLVPIGPQSQQPMSTCNKELAKILVGNHFGEGNFRDVILSSKSLISNESVFPTRRNLIGVRFHPQRPFP